MATAKTSKSLTVFQLVMIAIVSVDSLRNLPIGAQYGGVLITLYLIAGLTFFLPLAWTSAKLAVKFPNTGGSYWWIEAAFGKRVGSISIWLQWIYNIIWYPTIFAFITSTMLSLIKPGAENNPWLIFVFCTTLFWLLTFIHSYGIKISSLLSTVSAIIGTLLPMTCIIGLAIYWLMTGTPSATPLSVQNIIPNSNSLKDIGFFSNILFSLLGLEVIAMHAGNVTNPERSYPRALLISAAIILTSLILSSIALCVIIPANKIGLINGVMEVFQLFFTNYQFPLGSAIIGWCIVIGGLGIAASWMIGVARGLHTALSASNAPKKLLQLNKNAVPLNVLYSQGLVYTLLLSTFVLLPSLSNTYWLLSVISAQFALVYYVLLFAAAIKLLKAQNISAIALPLIAGMMCLIGIIVGFIPPSSITA